MTSRRPSSGRPGVRRRYRASASPASPRQGDARCAGASGPIRRLKIVIRFRLPAPGHRFASRPNCARSNRRGCRHHPLRRHHTHACLRRSDMEPVTSARMTADASPRPPVKAGWHDLDETAYHADPCPTPSLSSHAAMQVIGKSLLHAWRAHPRSPGFEPQAKVCAACCCCSTLTPTCCGPRLDRPRLRRRRRFPQGGRDAPTPVPPSQGFSSQPAGACADHGPLPPLRRLRRRERLRVRQATAHD